MSWLHTRYYRHINRKMLILLTDSVLFRIRLRKSIIVTSQVKPFSLTVQKYCSFSTANSHPEIILKEFSRNTPVPGEDIPIWLLKYEQSISQMLHILHDGDDVISQRKHVLHNFLKDDLMNLSIRNAEFENILNDLDSKLDMIPIRKYPVILKSLTKLFVPEDNSLMAKLYRICSDNMDLFDIQELALLAQCAFVNNNINFCAQIVQNLQILLENSNNLFVSSASDIGMLFRCLGFLMSHKMIDQCVSFVIDYTIHKSVLDFSSLRLFCELSKGSCDEAKEILLESILQSGIVSLDSNFNFKELDLESCIMIGGHLDSLFGSTLIQSKVRHLCSSYMSATCSTLTPSQAFKLACFLPTRYFPSKVLSNDGSKQFKFWLNDSFLYSLSQHISHGDNHQLIQCLRLSHQTKLPLKILSQLHDHLVKTFGENYSDKLQPLLDEDEEILVYLYHFILTLKNLDFSVSKNLVNFISKQCDPDQCSFPVTKTRAALVIHSLTCDLFKDKLHKKEIVLFQSLLNQLNISSLMRLYGMPSKGRTMNSQRRAQVKYLSLSIDRCLQDKLYSIHHLSPNPHFQDIDGRWSVQNHVLMYSGIRDTVLFHLDRLTKDLNQRNCLRAIEMLCNAASYLPLIKPSLFENLLQFVYSHDGTVPVHAFLSLLHVLSSSAYRPKDFVKFKSVCQRFQEDARFGNLLSHDQQVLLAYCLSLYRIYDKDALKEIFSTQLERELQDPTCLHSYFGAKFYRKRLYLLRCSVALECPLPIDMTPLTSPIANSGLPSSVFINGVRRIFHNSPHISVGTQSAYGHRIDALVILDKECNVIDPNVANIDDNYKLAFLYLSSKDWCYIPKGTLTQTRIETQTLTGEMKAMIRQLKRLGYFVVEVPSRRLYGMDMRTDQAVDNYLREQIIQAIGPRLLLTESHNSENDDFDSVFKMV